MAHAGGTTVKKRILTIFLCLIACGAAQEPAQPVAPTTISQALDSWVIDTENHIVPVAEVMPEDKYAFAPANGEFKGVRTFAQQVKHLAANNYAMAALIRGDKPTREMQAETGPETVKTKAEIIVYLKGSFEQLHRAVATIDEKNLMESLNTGLTWQNTRSQLVIDAVAHSFDHYGQLVEYLRMNGIVPPASRPKEAR